MNANFVSCEFYKKGKLQKLDIKKSIRVGEKKKTLEKNYVFKFLIVSPILMLLNFTDVLCKWPWNCSLC